jgi:hypothetical protein
MWRFGIFPCLFLALGGVSLGQGAVPSAKPPFDGAWVVMIVTEKGTCDPMYRYAVLVADGKVVSDARESTGTINISGKIEPDGHVTVKVRRGEQRADGTGKLSETAGVGKWTGKSSSANCSGRWEATRNKGVK